MSTPAMLRRPIMGGLFGHDEFELATQPLISNGLHAVRFMVIQARTGRVLAIADSKPDVLAGARRVLTVAAAANDSAPSWMQECLWPEAEPAAVPQTPRPVSRRRREVFMRSGGRCHYCGTPLSLHGAWHVEHQIPRALGGTDEALNLVAACEHCNLQKGARTALEFIRSCGQ